MYFKNRTEAGKKLADKLEPKYRYENCVVIALSDGGVVVGSYIAARLHCALTMLLTAPINLPRESEAVGVIDQEGVFTYNNMFSAGDLEEMQGEYRGLIEQEKLQKLRDMTELLGENGLIKRDLLRGRNIILVSDGLNSGFSLDAAANYLKPVAIERTIVATPIATVPAVDRMHVLADEIYCLSVIDNFINVNHYYDKNDIPDHDTIIKTLQQIVLHWK